jgi:hypothetical protein
MESTNSLQAYESGTLRPFWDRLRRDALNLLNAYETATGDELSLNWESVRAEFWDRTRSHIYGDMVVKWAGQVSRTLQEVDPEGTSSDLVLTSLRRCFGFHVDKLVFLQQLGISVPPVPSDIEAFWKGTKAGIGKVADFVMAPFGLPWGVIALGAAAVLAVVLFRRG